MALAGAGVLWLGRALQSPLLPCGSTGTNGSGRDTDAEPHRASKSLPEQLYFKSIIVTIKCVFTLTKPLLGYFSEVYFHTGISFSFAFALLF